MLFSKVIASRRPLAQACLHLQNPISRRKILTAHGAYTCRHKLSNYTYSYWAVQCVQVNHLLQVLHYNRLRVVFDIRIKRVQPVTGTRTKIIGHNWLHRHTLFVRCTVGVLYEATTYHQYHAVFVKSCAYDNNIVCIYFALPHNGT